MLDKRLSLHEVVASIPDGAVLALGGNTLHRAPCAVVHELVRQGKRDLTLVKTASSYDTDLLCGAGCVRRAELAFVGFENVFGLAPRYRQAIETGRVKLREHACYSIITGLRAAVQGVPFLPIAGMHGSDVVAASGFKTVQDPYSGQTLIAVQALQPDVAVVHVQEADAEGNGVIYGTRFEDVLAAQAARRVVLTCERVVPGEQIARRPELTAIPGYLVEAVVEAPRGAWPLSCAGEYDYDHAFLAAYVDAARASGASAFTIVRVHVLGNVLGPIFVYSTSLISVSMILASGLSFLGLGVKPPEPEWGLMLNTLRTAIYTQPAVAALPGVMIFITSVSFNLLSDGLRSAMDNKGAA